MKAAQPHTDPVRGVLAGARAATTIAAATFALGVSFGALAHANGWSTPASVAFSALAFSGAAQFAAVAVLGAGGAIAAAVAAAALLSARFLPMGVSVAASLRGGRLRRGLEGLAIVDASWVLAARPGNRFDRYVLFGSTLAQYPAWVGGTVVGVLAGPMLGDLDALGLDVAFPVFFLSLLAEDLRERRDGRRTSVGVAVGAAVLAVALVPVAPPGVPVIAACLVALAGAVLTGRRTAEGGTA
jgi:4-azaleucine resistance transporter AzlC